jgi:hypothetical protein
VAWTDLFPQIIMGVLTMDDTKVDNFTAVGLAEGWISGTEEEVVAAWQHLHDTGLAYQLQGSFGRTARAMIEAGIIHDNH